MLSQGMARDSCKECANEANLEASDVSKNIDLDDVETELAESTEESSPCRKETADSWGSLTDGAAFDLSRGPSQHELDSETEEADSENDDRFQSLKKNVKLIFLDMDGPIVPYKMGQEHHEWNSGDDFADVPYAAHVSELRRIIDMSGGPDVVKVVLSSSWRTDEDKMPWLKAQFERCGIDMIGHTDVIHTHPVSSAEMSRNVEIHRVLQSGTLGRDGPRFDEVAGGNKFSSWQLPPNWQITDWIAIDDLRLDGVRQSQWKKSKYFVAYLPLEDDVPEARAPGWYQHRDDFASSMAEFHQEFAARHFVYADPEGGLANTIGAADDAISLLNASSSIIGVGK